MTRKMAGIVRQKRPTRATPRRSLNSYCRPMEQIGVRMYRDAYGQKYEATEKGPWVKR